MIDNAIIQMDEETRNKALAEAMAMAIEEVALIPLHAQAVIVAAKNGLSYTPRANEQLLAYFVRQAK
jgi:peptide/nickel transport system substrate-binding protein